MNILALDCAVTRISLAVKTESKFISSTYDIGMRQSEILVPSIDEILKKADISAADLNATALTIGPGSFTGLRLGISALKAIELAYGVPVYGISSLEAYAYPYKNLELPVISCIDANKDKFYCNISDSQKCLLEDGDWEVEKITETAGQFDKALVCGPDAAKLAEKLNAALPGKKYLLPASPAMTAESLIKITEELINKKAEPLKDFDGPVYLRASEAELKLNSSIS
jgi:tRNA threonylcarbamoyladenosine biosynthesis protein TsaB